MTASTDPSSRPLERAGSPLKSLLSPLVNEATAAVLVVDLDRREVTYTNELARQLAPGAALPMPVDDWSQAAGLEDVSGAELPEESGLGFGTAATSLLQVAEGDPLAGEAVTAMRATAAFDDREVLWVIGLPLDGAPDSLAHLSLVVFIPTRDTDLILNVQESAVTLRDRAVLATRVSFTITDPSQPDNPLVWVNPAFTETTGYSFAEAVGRNCRFLQGPDTDRGVVDRMRASLEAGQPLTTTVLNYRKDGSTFWNELSMSPVRDQAGGVTHFVGVQTDVTARVEAQEARDDAISEVAAAADRLSLLADFTSQMAMSQRPEGIVEILADALVPRVATWCAVFVFDDAGNVRSPTVMHEAEQTDPAVAERVAALRDVVPDQNRADSPIWRVLRGEVRDVLITDYQATAKSSTDGRASLIGELGAGSLIVVPLLARAGILGCVVLVADPSRPALSSADVALAQDIAVRAGLMLENTQLYARERAAAAALQRNLLPRLPTVEGMTIAADYVPAADEAAVGGDWYDVFPLRGGAGVGVVLGDVMGHNIDSAARMGKLSTIVRAYGWPGSDPHTVLTAVDELLAGSGMNFLATCVYATLTPHEGGVTLRYSSAGHPPVIVREPDGVVRALDGGRGPMIGVSRLLADSTRPADAVVELAHGSMLICFTDGLTDAFGAEPDMDEGLAELCRLAASMPMNASPRQIIDRLTAAAVRHTDDVAVVALCID